MGYKWKPSAEAKAAYSAKMRAAETSYTFIDSRAAIRTGCRVTWFDVESNSLLAGVIERHSYGQERGQHTFSVRLTDGGLKLVKGRNLYPRLTAHEPGAESQEIRS
jgi:hypothetical protein